MPLHILHIHSTFDLGGKEARAVRLMNAFGDAARHSVVSVMPGALGARATLEPAIAVEFPRDHPPVVGKPGIARYRALARWMRGFDLVLTYNWGAMDAVGARRLFGGPPLVHHEDGFNQDEAIRLKPVRTLFRRATLPTAHALAVPSHTLERIARTVWRQPAGRVRRIANGIPVERYAAAPEPEALPGFFRSAGEVVIGTVAGLRPVKDLVALVRALADLPAHMRLVIVGDGPERDAIERTAHELGLGGRVLLTGFLDRPWRYVGAFDCLALSSLSEQQPIAVIEAMAAGLPVVSTDVGDVAEMVAHENRRFVVPPRDGAALAAALRTIGEEAALRAALGRANRAKARAEFGEEAMIAAYRMLYAEALGRPGAFGQGLFR